MRKNPQETLKKTLRKPCYMGENRQIFTERVQTLGSRLEDSHAPSFADGICAACKRPHERRACGVQEVAPHAQSRT